MHGDPPGTIAAKHRRHAERRERFGLPPMLYGVAAYAIVRDTEAEARRELSRITDVKGCAGYNNYQQWCRHAAGTARVAGGILGLQPRIALGTGRHAGPGGGACGGFEEVGVDLLLLQCSPQLEEMERFAESVIAALTPD